MMQLQDKGMEGGLNVSRYAMCPNCGRRMRRYRDFDGYWDGETYICDYCTD
jgi:predicted RNA-binding Zn-ribbon protein involved in translation (DUF1610 family)